MTADNDTYAHEFQAAVEAAYHHLRMEMLLEVMDAAGIEQVARPWSPAEEWKRVLNILRERNPMTTWCYTCEAEVPVPHEEPTHAVAVDDEADRQRLKMALREIAAMKPTADGQGGVNMPRWSTAPDIAQEALDACG